MSSHQTSNNGGLPSNAYTELKQGEQYVPIMSPAKIYPEVNAYSVLTGIVMAVVFSAAAAYLGLKVGQVFEAAIPIAILAVGLTNLLKKKDGMGQNVIIQSIGSSSGAVVAGAIFTLPGIYILNLEATFFQMFFASLLGGLLGILFLIPFRKYFVSEMHGKLPFPEATATTEILVAGEKGGNSAAILAVSGLIGGVYDFLVATFGTWAEIFTSRIVGIGEVLADKYKLVFRLNTSAAVVGLGYVIGLKYSVIIVAGSFLSYFVLVPIIAYFGEALTVGVGANVTMLIKDMSPELIFRNYVRNIGIGAIAMAGFIGIVRSSGVIKSAVSLAFKEISGKKESTGAAEIRTQKDLSMKIIVLGIAATAVVLFVFFLFGVVSNLLHALVGLLIVMIMSFLFTTVAANAIAITGNNPVSGMTLMTLVLSSIILVSVGLSGPTGMVSALIIGGVVCTALSVAGSFVTDLKIGYWLGSTPQNQEKWKFVGAVVSAFTIVWVMILINNIYGFGNDDMPAPQASAMAAIIQPLMSDQPVPWMLYISGACIALILAMIKVPVLAFALGMYLPQEINTPLLIGGLISHYVSTRSKDESLNNARRERGTLIASGFIAGGAIMGVASMIIRSTGANWVMEKWSISPSAEILSFIMFCLLCVYTIWDSLRAKK